MAKPNTPAPIIIKRKRVVAGEGHHGGAWKVAYADFVTAMMAFFLLMWLLNATTDEQRDGLADYFSPALTISQSSAGGERDLKGSSVFSEEIKVAQGLGATADAPTSQDQASGATSAEDAEQEQALTEMREAFLEMLVESPEGSSLLPHVSARVTDEGLQIELKDRPNAPLFDENSEPSDTLKPILYAVAKVSKFEPKRMALETHVSGSPIVRRGTPSWDESRARVDSLYETLRDDGLDDALVARLTAHGDREPLHENLFHPENNRIEITFLR